ncbi:hypothetical protein PSU4_48130 [Pseudonocardia sulfidoxydans NBRC 16205]|uniref:Luciferase-like domain-containing protein n=1 Tax=Pseudonocardia sulfidoxydans NBRC 16205 TaxID=1223511 RepID=A0A511DM13_9PSEU|nr:hypothetical protein PSU4_48130 [Pseudonocardia sulfidoxydans NBRC 16205]
MFVRDGGIADVHHSSSQFDVHGRFSVPRSPQGHPVLIQAGDSAEGRDFAAATADAIFTLHGSYDAGRDFYADVKGRAVRHGRRPEDLLVLPGATFVLGDTDADAADRAVEVRRAQVGPQTAIAFLEQIWGRDLSGYDADGPLPAIDPDVDNVSITRGRVRHARDPRTVAQEWRDLAAAKGGLSIRETVIEATSRTSFIGSARTVAAELDRYVQGDACDGFILIPHLTPGGLDAFADTVVPELQDRGSLRTEYTGTTLRENLGLRPTARPATDTTRRTSA